MKTVLRSRHFLPYWAWSLCIAIACATSMAKADTEKTVLAEPAMACPDKVELQQITQNVWQVPVMSESQLPEAVGMAFPVGIIHTAEGLVLIDAGPSHQFGEQLQAQLQCEFKLPVQAIVYSHAGPENTLAASAFSDLSAERLYASADVAAYMQAHCPQCLETMRQSIGEAAIAKTQIRPPASVLHDDGDVASVLGKGWQMFRYPKAFSDEDLVYWNADAPALFLGGLAAERRLPQIHNNSHIMGWLSALENLQLELGRAQAPPYMLAQLRESEAYLSTIQKQVCSGLRTGISQYQMLAQSHTDFAAYQSWQGFKEVHTLNMQRAWRQIEEAWIAAPPDPCI